MEKSDGLGWDGFLWMIVNCVSGFVLGKWESFLFWWNFLKKFGLLFVVCFNLLWKDVVGIILWRKESECLKNERNESGGSGFWNERIE